MTGEDCWFSLFDVVGVVNEIVKRYASKSVDSEVVGKHGGIILGLNRKGQTVKMTRINASTYKKT